MNLTTLLIIAIIITALAAAVILWLKFQKSWPVIYVKRQEDRAKEATCDITYQAYKFFFPGPE